MQQDTATAARSETGRRVLLWTLCLCAFEAERTDTVYWWAVDTIVGQTPPIIDSILWMKRVLWVPIFFDDRATILDRDLEQRLMS